MGFGPICIGKRIMICLQTFEDDVFCVVRVDLYSWLPMN